MSTQGLVTITQGKKVVMKIVAGCDGNHAPKLARAIKRSWPLTAEQAYDLAEKNSFGSRVDLVVMTEDKEIFKGDEDLTPLYRRTFQKPGFNPRWKCGICDNTVIIDISKKKKGRVKNARTRKEEVK